MNFSAYTFSFTAASALLPETLAMAEEYLRLGDWEAVKQFMDQSNTLHKVKKATFTREFREVRKRVSELTPEQLELLVHGSRDDTRAMIHLGMVKAYAFFHDFILEVVRNKFQLYEISVTGQDYDRFVEQKALTHPELNALSPSTSSKIKQVVFRMLAESRIIDTAKHGVITKPILSPQAIDVITKDQPRLLACFLQSNTEIKTLLTNQPHVPSH